MADPNGKTALVTGASRGIGRAMAKRLARDGALVIVHYGSNDEAAKHTVAEIEDAGGRAFAVKAELGRPGDVDTLFAGIDAELGPDAALDIVVNNAGITAVGPIESITPDDYDRVFAVNTRAPFFITQRALPRLRDGGRIIFVSSGNTRVAMGMVAPYAMTKAALEMLTRCLANDLGARGITVNTVMPGVTDTDMAAGLVNSDPHSKQAIIGMTALGRFGDPADIADATAFLVSDQGRWVTGHVLDATGGMWLGPIIR